MIKATLKSSGFTLLEVVIAICVLSVGLLGLASLQGTSLKLNSSALMRSQATNLAASIVDAMRANRAAVFTGAYDATAPTTPPACANNVSLTGTIAAQDLKAWRNSLACTFPSGTGSIVRRTVGANTVVTVTIEWNDNRGKEDSTDNIQKLVMATDFGQE